MPPVYEALLLNTVVPQIQAAQAGDSYVMVVNATTPALRITQTGTGNAISVEDEANPDATPFVVTATGDVGIGTNAPGEKLEVSGNARVRDALVMQRSSSSSYLSVLNYGNTLGGTKTDNLSFGLVGAGDLLFYTNGTQAMTLDSIGNLGVGTTSPVNLSGAGDLTAQRIFASQRSTAFPAIAFATDTNTGIDWPAADTLAFNTGGTERARITSGGNFLVGTDNAAENAGPGMKVLNTGGTVALVSTASDSSQQGFEMYSTGAAAYRLYVNYAGTINATNTTISAISDQRLKENIQDLDVGLNAVMALKPRKFDWKAGKGKDIKGDRGWIAQEFEQVFPDMIDTWRDPAPEGEEPYKAVRADLIPVLVKAIQELKAEVDSLKAQLEAK
jgi:hypothetical protein